MMSVFNSQMAQKQWAGRQTDKKKEGKKAGRGEGKRKQAVNSDLFISGI